MKKKMWDVMYSAKKKVLCVVFFTIITITGFEGVKIQNVELPIAIHNGTGPVELSCSYQINEEENGLVIKWYHDGDQIYQWIPPMEPQDIGIISGLTEYPTENMVHPQSHSIIRLKKVTVEMTGNYTCSVSTFSEDAAAAKHMTVYVPDHDLRIYASPFNKTHINLTCVARGARPRPSLSIIVNDHEMDNSSIRFENYRNFPWIRQEAIVPDFPDVNVVQCEIYIPGTGYRKRRKFVYYPRQYIGRSHVSSHYPSFLIFIISSAIIY
ncbi:uncharacterized protein LOC107044174 [Diachasma alloeum]|uniref:uncharacterized protein LOC107044174 n=1 Tax=Diachasma alloeum TaxID=454923 RepID=UPI0007382275|nr:uncharacterized protein LOC107044174 [Diachasma alloeum]